MSNNGIKVSPETMKMHGEKAGRMTEEFKSKINNLNSYKNGLMQIWKGPSATEFDSAADIQVRKLNEFQSVLEEMSIKIKEGAATFERTEEENVQESRRLQDTDYNF